MIRRLLIIAAAGLLLLPTPIGGRPASAAPGDNHVFDDALSSPRLQWWKDARFGMFIHWGLYSAYRGYHGTCRGTEWIKRNCGISDGEYAAKAATWNPTSFDANAIVQLAKDAGQKYIVITSKHHDGFAMWPTAVNDWNIRDRTPFQRDPLRELADAARANGIRFGVYYSIWDWHDPDFNSNFPAYLSRARAQLRELVAGYDIDLLWFDGEWDGATNPSNPYTTRDGEALEQYARSLKPSLLVNNRVNKRRPVDGDYGTPEQSLSSGPPKAQLQESCMTISSSSWGYAEWDTTFKSPQTLTRNLIKLVSDGANYLLNIGPTDAGTVTGGQANALRGMGAWIGTNGSAIYGAGYTGLVTQPTWGRVTRKGNKLYLAAYNWGGTLHLGTTVPFAVTGARVLGTGTPIAFSAAGDGYDFVASGSATSPIATVIEVDIVPRAAAAVGNGTGLKAEFWNNSTFNGVPSVTRLDPRVNYAWRWSGSPAASIATDNFSSRWTGTIQPRYSEPYTFTTASDDTAQLWVNGQLIISNTTPHGITQQGGGIDQATIMLTAGVRYDIRLQHTENGGEAYLKLIWSSPSTPAEIVPTSQLYPPDSGVAGRTYTLTAQHSGKLADVRGASSADNAAVIQWPATGSNNQKWQAIPTATAGVYTLQAVHSGKCLDVNGASTADGAAIVQLACNNQNNQKWQAIPTATAGVYTLQAVHSGKCLDVNGGSTADGAALIQWTCHSNPNQQWRLTTTS